MSRVVTDPLGRRVTLGDSPPQRIVSLCPSQTELLFSLGVGPCVVGRTRWCVHPTPDIERVAPVGGTKKVNLARVRELAPDLILCEKEENTPDMVAELETLAPTYVTNVESVADALAMIAQVGSLVGREHEATQLVSAITARWTELPTLEGVRVAYLIWREPWMAVGPHTYIHDVLCRLGLTNVFAEGSSRYPETTLADLRARRPQRVLLSSEPYSFTAADADALARELPGVCLDLVDGEAFSWYGSRMLPAADTLAHYARHLLSEPDRPFRG